MSASPPETPPTSRRSKLLRGALEVIAVVALLFGIRAYQSRDAVRGPAPALVARNLDGQAFDLSALRGQPFALHFWASWCGVCSAMRHNVQDFAQGHRVVTVASRSGTDRELRSFVAQHALGAPVIADPQGAIAQVFGVHAFPTTFFIDAQGVIRHVEVGYTTELGMVLRLWSAGL